MKDAGLLETLARLLESGGIDLAAWGLAWARVLPLVVRGRPFAHRRGERLLAFSVSWSGAVCGFDIFSVGVIDHESKEQTPNSD